MTAKLMYPTLDLFIYVLRNGLGQDANQVKTNREVFKQLLPLTETDSQEFDQLDNQLEGNPGEGFGQVKGLVTQEKKRFLPWWPAETETEVDGAKCFPVRLGDTYAVLFNSSFKYSRPVEDLTQLKAPFEDRMKVSIPSEIRLGHTWLFSTAVSLSDPAEIEELAKQCYKQLLPDSKSWKEALVASPGNFLDSTIFELEGNGGEHLLMMFHPAPKGEDQAKDIITATENNFNGDWSYLFWYRHKILWAHRQGLMLKKDLEKDVLRLSTARDEFKNLEVRSDYQKVRRSFDHADKVFYEYATRLALLEQQSHTIDVNQLNYQKRLRLIEKKAGQPLTCLNPFHQQVQDFYRLQLQKDHASFHSQLKVWEVLINYVRAKVAVEKEEREHHFQHRVSIFAVALAAGAMMASISGHFPTSATVASALTNAQWPWDWLSSGLAWLAPGFSVLISFGTALLAGWITKIWLDKKW